jgi:serine protease AprX
VCGSSGPYAARGLGAPGATFTLILRKESTLMRTVVSRVRPIVFIVALLWATVPAFAQGRKLGPLADRASTMSSGFSAVVIQGTDVTSLAEIRSFVQGHGGFAGRDLPIINGHAAVLPNAFIKALSDSPAVLRVSIDRDTTLAMERTGATVGATTIRQQLGYTGAGIGVALIDSGITSWHDDLSSAAGGQRIVAWADFVNGRTQPYDDQGHGTHVAGIVAGNGYDSSGARSGIAPGVSLVVLKALDVNGRGRISQVIAAMDYVLAHKAEFNIRIVNLSLSTGVYESYNSDPLTLAAKRLVDAGIVVVAAAGNQGVGADGRTHYGGITAPGNAPWVLTVGASSHMGTVNRYDDTMAIFSSRGPTAIDITAKPDIVAPGVGLESLSDPLSAFYTSKSQYLLDGTVPRSYKPYLSLSGTSMATPVVAGSVALMMQGNSSLTPNSVKAILQYTAEIHPLYNRLTQGVGFLNTAGAVQLAAFLGGRLTTAPSNASWSREIVWGNHLVKGGTFTSKANAWSTAITWGANVTPSGKPITWGVVTGSTDPWTVPCADASCSSVSWGSANSRNVVWGATCGGSDCTTTWNPTGAGTALTTTSENEIVVWGSAEYDENQIVVWGSADSQMVVWGSSGEFEIVVWGSDCQSCEPVLWSK